MLLCRSGGPLPSLCCFTFSCVQKKKKLCLSLGLCCVYRSLCFCGGRGWWCFIEEKKCECLRFLFLYLSVGGVFGVLYYDVFRVAYHTDFSSLFSISIFKKIELLF